MERTPKENFEENQKLLKEILRRANKKEKQKYEQISDKQIAIVKRILAIMEEFEELTEKSKRNKLPEKTSKYNNKRASEMSDKEIRRVDGAKQKPFQ